MIRYNILWGLLHGGSDTTTDWVRGTSERLGADGRSKAASNLLPETDDSIRGWFAETVLQSALSSTRKDTILSMDPVNTYKTPLSDPADRLFTTRPNFQSFLPVCVYAVDPPVVPGMYHVVMRMTKPGSFNPPHQYQVYVDGSYTFSFKSPVGSSSSSVTFSNGYADVGMCGGTVRMGGVRYDMFSGDYVEIHYKGLPSVNAIETLSRRMRTNDFREDCGRLCEELLKEYL